MLKKIIVTVLLVGLVGILFIGAVNRTLARSSEQGHGRQAVGIEDSDLSFGDGSYDDQSQDNEGYGWGRGRQDLSSGNSSQSTESDTLAEVGNNGGYGQKSADEVNTHEFNPTGRGELDEAEKEALLFMREEEKLAHDVYVVMYELWGLPIFQNISTSEQSHMEAVKTLLDAYNVADPASDKPGVFSNPDLQILYNDLVAQGSQSLSEALRVGAAIEEIDILDLQERLSQTENVDIQNVFTNLLKGSSNHLRAFSSTLMTQTGETYVPQFMSLDDYQSILGDSTGSGNQTRGSRGGRGGRP